jgi:hypothetical protein
VVSGAGGAAVRSGVIWCDEVRHAAFGAIGVLGCLAAHAVVVDHGRVGRPVCTGRLSGSSSGSPRTGVWTLRCRGERWPCDVELAAYSTVRDYVAERRPEPVLEAKELRDPVEGLRRNRPPSCSTPPTTR